MSSVEPIRADDAATVAVPFTSSTEHLNALPPYDQHATARLALSADTDGYPDELPPLSTASAPRDSEPSLDIGGSTGAGGGGGEGKASVHTAQFALELPPPVSSVQHLQPQLVW